MKRIRVHTPFTFNDSEYNKTDFDVGVHNVKNEIADHWFTQRYAEVLDKTDNGGEGASQAEIGVLNAKIAELTTQNTELTAKNVELTAQVTAAAEGLTERNALIDEQKQKIAELTEQVNGAKKQ
ncbi:STY1053 family phage-associated protein [Pantoea ananatis]